MLEIADSERLIDHGFAPAGDTELPALARW